MSEDRLTIVLKLHKKGWPLSPRDEAIVVAALEQARAEVEQLELVNTRLRKSWTEDCAFWKDKAEAEIERLKKLVETAWRAGYQEGWDLTHGQFDPYRATLEDNGVYEYMRALEAQLQKEKR